VTLRDVAALAGVHPSAVSRVVNGDDRVSLSEATRGRILGAVEQLGYRSNQLARGLRMSRTLTVGVVLPDLSNPMYASIIQGVQRRADELGYAVVLEGRIDGEGAAGKRLARLLEEGRVDGLLVASGTLHDNFLRDVARRGPGPVVPMNRCVEGVKASVVVDDEAGSATATRHLAALGHERLVGVFGPSEIDTSRRRQAGFERAAGEAGCEATTFVRPSWTASEGYLGTKEALEIHERPTAVFASTVLMGIGALRALSESGLAVPDDVSVICLHDAPLADFLNPPMTAVQMPTELLGAEALDLLVSLSRGEPEKAIVVPGNGVVIERESTGPPSRR
jgi:LacI family transcriptional regulator